MALAPTIDPMVRAAEVVARAGSATLKVHRPHDGAAGGRHVGSRRGGGVEFAEHREYHQGDDLRHLDWRAYARSDRLLVKRFETEVHSELRIVVDGSASMAFDDEALGRGVDKLDAVRLLAAALATVAVSAGDAVSLTIPNQASLGARAGRPALLAVLSALVALRGEGDDAHCGLGALRLDKSERAPASVVALSDGLDAPETLLTTLAAWRRGGADVVLVQTLHPLELDFDFPDAVALRCDERDTGIVHDPRRLREDARAMMTSHLAATRSAALAVGIRYHMLALGGDAAAALRVVLGLLAVPRGLR